MLWMKNSLVATFVLIVASWKKKYKNQKLWNTGSCCSSKIIVSGSGTELQGKYTVLIKFPFKFLKGNCLQLWASNDAWYGPAEEGQEDDKQSDRSPHHVPAQVKSIGCEYVRENVRKRQCLEEMVVLWRQDNHKQHRLKMNTLKKKNTDIIFILLKSQVVAACCAQLTGIWWTWKPRAVFCQPLTSSSPPWTSRTWRGAPLRSSSTQAGGTRQGGGGGDSTGGEGGGGLRGACDLKGPPPSSRGPSPRPPRPPPPAPLSSDPCWLAMCLDCRRKLKPA